MKKITFKTLFENNRFLMIFSGVIAIFCWITVSMTSGTTAPRSIGGVPVQIELQEEQLREMGLSVIGSVDTLADVMVLGPRTLVGNLEPEDVKLTVNLNRVTGAGTYDLPLISQGADDYTVTSINPSSVKVRLDEIVTDTLSVELISRGGSTSEDYLMDTERITPATVQITGPATELEQVKRCVAVVDLPENMTETFTADVPVVLLDEEGGEIDLEGYHIATNPETVNVRVPVLRIKELRLLVDFTNMPQSFPEQALRSYMTLSNESIMVAGPVNLMENYTELRVEPINIRELMDNNNVFRRDIDLPSDQFQNINGINTILVTFDDSTWASTVIYEVNNIQKSNIPAGYEVELLTGSLQNVTFVGDAAVIEELTSGDVLVDMNLSEKELTPGTNSYPVKVNAPGKGMVWATGDYSVIIRVTPPGDETPE